MSITRNILLAAAAVGLLLAGHLARAALFTSTGTYDEQAVETNTVDQSVGVKTVAQFTPDVLAAFLADRGGVVDFQTGFTNPGGQQTIIGGGFDADFGTSAAKTLTVNSNKDLHVYFDDTAGQVDTISDDNNLLPVANQELFSFTFAPIAGGGPREHVTEVGLTVLSRSVFDATGTAQVTAHYFGGGLTPLAADVGNTQGAGDAFFHFAAPPGSWITQIDFDGTLTGGADANKRRLPVDDFAFITQDFPLFVATGVYDEQTSAANAVDQSVGAKTISQFAADVAAAFDLDSGGVIDFETGTEFSGAAENIIGESFDAGFGANFAKRLTVTADRQVSVWQNNTAGQVEVISSLPGKDNNLLTGQNLGDLLLLEFGAVEGGLPREFVTEVGLTVLSRDQFDATGTAMVTAYFHDGTFTTLSADVGSVPGEGDAFFHFAAPKGSWIESIELDGSQSGGTDLQKRRLPFDDLAFITQVIPEPSTLALAAMGLFGLTAFARRRRKPLAA